MINFLNTAGEHWFDWQFAMLWQTAVLIGIIWIVDLAIRKWAHPQVRYALWMLVLVKLLIPPTWTSPASVTSYIPDAAIRAAQSGRSILAPEANENRAATSLSSPPAKGEYPEGGRGLNAVHAPVSPDTQRGLEARVPLETPIAMEQAGTPVNHPAQPSAGLGTPPSKGGELLKNSPPAKGEYRAAGRGLLSWKTYAMLTWLAGIIVLATWLVVRLSGLRREHNVSSSCHPGLRAGIQGKTVWMPDQVRHDNTGGLPERFYAQLQEVAQKLNLKRIPRVVLTNKVACPAVFGVFRPVLLMPKRSTGILPVKHGRDGHATNSRHIEHILLHELAHIKRGDLVVHAVYMILQIVYWFNPLLWMVRRPMQNLRELCCDATVARLLREKTYRYRETLLETARQLLAEPVDPGLGLLGLFENNNWLVTRLQWLEKNTWKNRPLRIAAIVLIVGVMTTCVLPMAKGSTTDSTIIVKKYRLQHPVSMSQMHTLADEVKDILDPNPIAFWTRRLFGGKSGKNYEFRGMYNPGCFVLFADAQSHTKAQKYLKRHHSDILRPEKLYDADDVVDIDTFADTFRTIVHDTFAHQNFSFLTDNDVEFIAEDLGNFVRTYTRDDIPKEQLLEILEQLDAYIYTIFPSMTVFSQEHVYLAFDNRIKTLKLKLWHLIAVEPLSEQEKETLQEQKQWVYDQINNFSGETPLVTAIERYRIEKCFEDVFNGFSREPMPADVFEKYKADINKESSLKMKIGVASCWSMEIAISYFHKNPKEYPYPFGTISGFSGGSDRVDFRFKSDKPNLYENILLRGISGKEPCGYDIATRQEINAPNDFKTADQMQAWLNIQNKGDIYFDSQSQSIISGRDAKMTILDVDNWIEADGILTESLRQMIHANPVKQFCITGYENLYNDDLRRDKPKVVPLIAIETKEGLVAVIRPERLNEKNTKTLNVSIRTRPENWRQQWFSTFITGDTNETIGQRHMSIITPNSELRTKNYTATAVSNSEDFLLTGHQQEAVMPVFSGLADELNKLVSKYPELAEYRRLGAIKASVPDAIGHRKRWIELSYQHNFTAPKTKRGVQPSDFGEHGFYVIFKCLPISSVGAVAISPETINLELGNLGVWIYADIKTGPNPSPGLVEEVHGLLKLYSEKLKEIDKQTAVHSNQTNNYTATLTNGVTVELVGIVSTEVFPKGSTKIPDRSTWWDPTGIIIPQPQHQITETEQDGYAQVYMLAKIVSESDAHAVFRLPSEYSGNSTHLDGSKGGFVLCNLSRSSHPFFQASEKVDIGIGVAHGDWIDTGIDIESKSETGSVTLDLEDQDTIYISSQYNRDETPTAFWMQVNSINYQIKAEFTTTDGQVIQSYGSTYLPVRKQGKPETLRFIMQEITPKKIASYRLFYRKVEWAAFDNIALRPRIKLEIENVVHAAVKSLKEELIKLSDKYPELADVESTDIKGSLVDSPGYRFIYYHDCGYMGKRGYKDTGPNPLCVGFEAIRPSFARGAFPAPDMSWKNLDLFGWTSLHYGEETPQELKNTIESLLQKTEDRITRLDQSMSPTKLEEVKTNNYTATLPNGVINIVTGGEKWQLIKNPAWSSDQEQLTFTGKQNETTNIYTVNIDGTNLQQITNLPQGRLTWGPTYRPGTDQIYYMDNSVQDPGLHWIAFTSRNGKAGRNPLLMVPGGHSYSPARFSPEGKRFCFCHRQGYYDKKIWNKLRAQIKIANADGSNITTILDGNDPIGWVIWGRGINSNHLAYSKITGYVQSGNGGSGGVRSIYTIRTDGTQEKRITDEQLGDCFVYDWSPDGKKLLISVNDRQIYEINSDGTNPIQISNDNYENTYPVYSPDGTSILYVSKRAEKYFLCSMKLNPKMNRDAQNEISTSSFTATLPNGVTVELLGVCEYPSEGKQWWKPDGTYLDNSLSQFNAEYGSKGALRLGRLVEVRYKCSWSLTNTTTLIFQKQNQKNEYNVISSHIQTVPEQEGDYVTLLVGVPKKLPGTDFTLGIRKRGEGSSPVEWITFKNTSLRPGGETEGEIGPSEPVEGKEEAVRDLIEKLVSYNSIKEGMDWEAHQSYVGPIMEKLAELGDDAVPVLAEALKKGEISSRDFRFYDEHYGPAAARLSPAITKLLDDEDDQVRIRAIEALQHLRQEDAVPGLIRALKDDNPDVRWAAVNTFYWFCGVGKQATPVLIQTLKDEKQGIRWGAMDWLYGFSGLADSGSGVRDELVKVVPNIIQELDDDNFRMVTKAAIILGRIKDKRAVDKITQLLDRKFNPTEHILLDGKYMNVPTAAHLALVSITGEDVEDRSLIPIDNKDKLEKIREFWQKRLQTENISLRPGGETEEQATARRQEVIENIKYGGGAGTDEDPYQIRTAEQMNQIGLNEDDWDKHFALMQDIDLGIYQGEEFNIIGYHNGGNDAKSFKGVFDGKGHRIINFSYQSYSFKGYVGIFGYAGGQYKKGAIIRNLVLTNPTIEVGHRAVNDTGSLAGMFAFGTITNCHVVDADITGIDEVGGLVGSCIEGTITDCSVTGSIAGVTWVGGLTGDTSPESMIRNCFTNVAVNCQNLAGGLIGDNQGKLIQCYSNGSVIGVHELGGLAGRCSSTGSASNCYATSEVEGKYTVGGLLGEVYSYAVISNCYSSGKVTGDRRIGGLVGYGYLSSEVADCFWDIETSGLSYACKEDQAYKDCLGLTTAQMKQQATFSGWDFEKVWAIKENETLPYLRWQNVSLRGGGETENQN